MTTPRDQKKVDDAFSIMISTAVLQGFTTVVAILVLTRSRNIRLALVKLLLFFIAVSSLFQVISRTLYYFAIYNHYEGNTTTALKLFHANACITVVSMLLFGLVHWIYPFKLWDLSKRMQLVKEGKTPESSYFAELFFYSGMVVTAIGSCLYGWNAWFYKSHLAQSLYLDIAFMPQIVAIFLLMDGIRRINNILKDEPDVLSNHHAMRLHLFTFCLFGVTLSWMMI